MNRSDLPTAREMTVDLIAAIRELGGVATVREIENAVAQRLGLTSEQLAIPHDRSRSEYQYRLAWTRSYAKKEGLLISVRRNHWSLPTS